CPVVLSYTRYALLFKVVRSIAPFICAMIATLTGTLVAPLNGFELTSDDVYVWGPAAVVNCVVLAATRFPATSLIPDTASVITVDGGSGLCGVICTVWLLLLKLSEPGVIVWPPPLICTVVPFT